MSTRQITAIDRADLWILLQAVKGWLDANEHDPNYRNVKETCERVVHTTSKNADPKPDR